MNQTEEAAYKWLIKERSYSPEEITFAYRQNPDFVTADGVGYEVKLIRNRTITFTVAQLIALEHHPNVQMLFWNHSDVSPCLVVAFKDLLIPGYWRQYRLILIDQRQGLTFYRPLTEDEKAAYDLVKPTHEYPGAVRRRLPRSVVSA